MGKHFDRELDSHEVAVLAIGSIGATVEAYLEINYSDPMLYKLVEFVEELSTHLDYPDLTERLTFLKVRTGEAVNEFIDSHDIGLDRDEWSK